MNKKVEKFFWNLITAYKNHWEIHICFLNIEGKSAAGLITFESAASTLAYNSGFDPAFSFYSAGFLLHAFKIKEAIEKKKKTYDFLRGGERYKYDLGAKDLRLYKISLNFT